MNTPNRTVRIPDDEREAALKKGKGYGAKDFSAVVRLALHLLPAKSSPNTND